MKNDIYISRNAHTNTHEEQHHCPKKLEILSRNTTKDIISQLSLSLTITFPPTPTSFSMNIIFKSWLIVSLFHGVEPHTLCDIYLQWFLIL